MSFAAPPRRALSEPASSSRIAAFGFIPRLLGPNRLGPTGLRAWRGRGEGRSIGQHVETGNSLEVPPVPRDARHAPSSDSASRATRSRARGRPSAPRISSSTASGAFGPSEAAFAVARRSRAVRRGARWSLMSRENDIPGRLRRTRSSQASRSSVIVSTAIHGSGTDRRSPGEGGGRSRLSAYQPVAAIPALHSAAPRRRDCADRQSSARLNEISPVSGRRSSRRSRETCCVVCRRCHRIGIQISVRSSSGLT